MQHIPLSDSGNPYSRLSTFDSRRYGYGFLDPGPGPWPSNLALSRSFALSLSLSLSLSICPSLSPSLVSWDFWVLRFGFSFFLFLHALCVCLRAGWFRALCDERDGSIAREREAMRPAGRRVRERRAAGERESERQGCKPITVRLILGLVYN